MKLTDWRPVRLRTKINLQTWLVQTQNKLQGISDFPVIETYAITSFVLSCPKEWLIAHPEQEISSPQLQTLEELLSRLISGEPLPYLVGKQSFFGLEFEVTPEVLIPRPETELLIEEAIAWLERHPQRRTMIDVGTGSGIIPITLADHFDDLTVRAVDISPSALTVAIRNIQNFNLQNRIRADTNDLLCGIHDRFDMITANLPYIPSSRLESLAVTRFEPVVALDGGQDGFAIIRRLLEQAPNNLNPGGLILLEIDDSHASIAQQEAERFFTSAKIAIINDLTQRTRLLRIQA